MRDRFFRLLAVLLAGSAIAAQGQVKAGEMPLVELPLNSEPILTDIGKVGNFGPIMCDSSGAIYARFFTAGDFTQGPITRISPSGQTSRFEMPRNVGETPQQMLLFTVTPDGDLFEVLRVANHDANKKLEFQTLLVVFSRTGTLKSKTQFSFGFIPSILIPLANDEVLVGGAKIEAEQKASEGKQFLGVFSSTGQMRREFSAPGAETNAPSKGGAINPQFGKAVLGEDGNLYLLFPSNPPLLKVISQPGKLVRKVQLQEPFTDSSPLELFVSPNLVLVVFGPKPETRGKVAYVLYDSENGSPIQAYHPSFSGNAVCWNGKELRVIVTEKNRTGLLVGTASVP